DCLFGAAPFRLANRVFECLGDLAVTDHHGEPPFVEVEQSRTTVHAGSVTLALDGIDTCFHGSSDRPGGWWVGRHGERGPRRLLLHWQPILSSAPAWRHRRAARRRRGRAASPPNARDSRSPRSQRALLRSWRVLSRSLG